MSQPPKRFHIFKDADGDWRWALYAVGNGKQIAASGEGYKNRQDCISGARIVASTATDALMWDEAAGKYI